MDYATFVNYAEQCAPLVNPRTMGYLVKQESSFNPYAIGVVGGKLERQPTNLAEAVATARDLKKRGIRFSAGISQVYVGNFDRFSLDEVSVFDICKNLQSGSQILSECHDRATAQGAKGQVAIEQAMSCYTGNNFQIGFKNGYVQSIVATAYKARMGSGLAR